MGALDQPWNDIVAPVTDGHLELQEDLCRCEHRSHVPVGNSPGDTALLKVRHD